MLGQRLADQEVRVEPLAVAVVLAGAPVQVWVELAALLVAVAEPLEARPPIQEP